jgi:hypothetical protein
MNWYKKAINAPSLEALEQKYHNWLSERLIEESYNFTERFPLSPYELKFVQTYLMEVKPSISKLRTLKDISKLRTLKDVFINTMNYYTKMAETTNDPEVLDRIVEMGLKAQITYNDVSKRSTDTLQLETQLCMSKVA